MRRIIPGVGMLAGSLLFPFIGLSQPLSGTVRDSTGAGVPYASINLKKTPGESIIAYTITDRQGTYLLQIPVTIARDSLYLEVRCLGYQDQRKPVSPQAGKQDFKLAVSSEQLPEVIIRAKRPTLRTSGDTLSYKVTDFSSPQDRVIGEVIRKLPGITISADGTISYNNKPIAALYLDGDNLLDDRYSLAAGSIAPGVVEQVQVINNAQPINVLQGKVTSNDVALNLTVKKEAGLHLFGQESLGAGLPGNYAIDLNTMLFRRELKALNELKGNNTGYDLQQDLMAHNAADSQQRIGSDLPASWLSLGPVNTPALARSRYLVNRAGALTVNNLVKLKNQLQLRVNAFYLHDQQTQTYGQRTTIFLPGDTIDYTQTQTNHYIPDWLHAQFTLQLNTAKTYLNDVLLFERNRSYTSSELTTNGSPVNQALTDQLLNFSNELTLMRSTKSNHIVQAYSYISHQTHPESRTIEPNYQAGLFNKGVAYADLGQAVNVSSWYTHSYFAYKIPIGRLTQSFRTGFSLQSQALLSTLSVRQDDQSLHLASDSAVNHLHWNQRKLYAEAAYDLPGERLKANLSFPVTFQQIAYADNGYGLDRSLTRLYVNPQLQAKFMTSAENYVTLLYTYRNEVGTIEDSYRGAILKDYRTLYSNCPTLTLRQHQQVGGGFNYRKALTLFFWSITGSYDHSQSNTIVSSLVSNTLQQRIVIPYPNSGSSWTADGSISKYSFACQTTFSGSFQWKESRLVQLQNGSLLPFRITAQRVSLRAATTLNDRFNFTYGLTATQTTAYSAAEVAADRIRQVQQQATLNYSPTSRLQLKLSGEHYFTHGHTHPDLTYFFADASAKYHIKTWKADLELDGTNLLNVQTYQALYLSSNMLTSSSYSLRGRILLLKVLFTL